MQALYSQKSSEALQTQLEEVSKPSPEKDEVLLESYFSSINYKDALGVTGKGAIFKKLPIIGGIDVSGVVVESNSNKFKAGDKVVITGCGLGETHNGAYADFVCDHEKNIVPLNENLTLKEAMIYGTAGFTAALCLERMERNGQRPELGPILVTGATGGVGRFAISFFSAAGYEVHAFTGKEDKRDELLALGATNVLNPKDLVLDNKPLKSVCYGGVVDNLGGEYLSNLMTQVELWGNVACVGLASSYKLDATVMPLILRGVSLLGVSSNNTPWDLREKIWQKLGNDLKPNNLDQFLAETIPLQKVMEVAHLMLDRKTSGRYVVSLKDI